MADETLKRLVELIRSSVNCECVYLFGSRGEGTAEGQSDYDLLAIASLSSLLASIRILSSLRRALYEASPVPVDLVFLTPQSVFRYRNSLFLMIWNQSAKLVYGRKDILRDLRVGSFSPEETSLFYESLQEAMNLLRYIRIDQNLRVSIDHRALIKMRSMLLTGNILPEAESLRGRAELASRIRSEAMKENCDTHVVARSYADFIRGIREQSREHGHPPGVFYLGSIVNILIDTSHFRTSVFAQGQTGQYQFVSALMYFFQSMEKDPPSVDLLQMASRLLDSSFASEKAKQELNNNRCSTLCSLSCSEF